MSQMWDAYSTGAFAHEVWVLRNHRGLLWRRTDRYSRNWL